jgi:hypothetical protein
MAILNRQSRTAARSATSRANGRKSSGPKTPAGKKISSQNALQHGQHAQPAVRPLWQAMATLGEDPARYQAPLRETVGDGSVSDSPAESVREGGKEGASEGETR